MIDLSGMNNEELYALRKQINATLKDTSLTKSDLRVMEKLDKLLAPQLLAACPVKDSIYCQVLPNMEQSVFKLCDMTLGNYKLRKTPGHCAGTLGANSGGVIKSDPVDYENMCNDILAVIEKYAKEEK